MMEIEIQCGFCLTKGSHEDFSFTHEFVDKASDVFLAPNLRYIETYVECIECEAPAVLLSTLRI